MTEGGPKTSNLPLESADEQSIDKEKTDLVEYVRSDETPSLPLGSGYLGDPSSHTTRTLSESADEQSADNEKADLINNVRSLIKCMDVESAEKFLQENDKLPSFIADEMIQSGNGALVAKYLYKFKNLDQKNIAEKLMKKGLGWAITENWDNFTEVNRKEIALSLIEKGEGWAVARDIDTLREFDRDVFLKLIQSELDLEETDNVYSNVWGLKDLDEEIANTLISKKQSWVIAQHIDKFKGLDHKKIVLEIIKAEGGGSVAQNMDKFQGLDHNEIALKIIEADNAWHVGENLHKFKGLSKEAAIKLLGLDEEGLCKVVMFLRNFRDLDKEVAMKIIEMGDANAVMKNLDLFKGLDKEVAIKLMESPEGIRYVGLNLDKFEGLDDEIVRRLQEAGEGASLVAMVPTPEE